MYMPLWKIMGLFIGKHLLTLIDNYCLFCVGARRVEGLVREETFVIEDTTPRSTSL